MVAIDHAFECYNGIVEVAGSIPAGSTKQTKGLAGTGQALSLCRQRIYRRRALGDNIAKLEEMPANVG